MKNIQEIEDLYSLKVYPKRDLTIVRGEGARVWDEAGRSYIDCMAGHGVANIGHANLEVAQAISNQAKRLITCPSTLYNDSRALLLEKLVGIAPAGLNKVFLSNSGAESIEAAFKFARLSTGRTNFVSTMRAFHGRTMGALSATFNPKHREGFEPLVPGFQFIPFNDIEKLQQSVNEQTAAVILEVIQGEAGVYPGSQEYFDAVRAWCDNTGTLLIIDEIQTGLGRTGKMFACEHFAIKPDILCLAKALAGGLPIGATLCNEKIKVTVGSHGSTFGGNPLVCAAALATLNFILDHDLCREATEKGVFLINKLRAITSNTSSNKIREVRGLGLMIGIEIREKVTPYVIELMSQGVLALPTGTTILRLLPPLVITYAELEQVAQKIEQVLG